jgi:serine/threonine-protein kinase
MLLDVEEFKRNPSVHFDYNYVVDTEPTKFIPAIDRSYNSISTVTPSTEEPPEDEERSKMLPILIGVFFGVVAIVALILGGSYLVKQRDSRVTVGTFIGMTRKQIEEKATSDYKDYAITYKTQANAAWQEGTVFDQDPDNGEKVNREKSDNKVHLIVYIAESTTKKVPDVVGKNVTEATQELKNAGFKTFTVPKVNLDVPEGTVISTDPTGGSMLAPGEMVTINMAVRESQTDQVAVPALIGWTQDKAQEMLEQAGLVLDPNVQKVDSSETAGKIVWQSVDANKKVALSSAITIRVSNGTAPTRTLSLSINLQDAGGREVELKAYLNSVLQKDVKVRLDGGKVPLSITGSGANQKLSVTLDGTTIYSATVDFTTNPPKASEILDRTYSEPPTTTETTIPEGSAVVPNVVRLSSDDAIAALNAAGFYNISIEEKNDASVILNRSGTVVSQEPRKGSILDMNEAVIIFVKP